ncbi:MAG TPA: response regulator [Pirellulales bacterium]|jgi:signal transduction histidine kinase|nr:response regulator [Pirellulales bacterium]
MIAVSNAPVYFLLVDDLPENLLALDGLLRQPGLTLLKANSGREALELLLKHDVALALVDVQMPSMDGFELAELMRGTERTKHVPIIFITAGTADRARRFKGYEAGAVDFLHKPIEPDILKSKAKVFFDLYRQRQEVALQRDELRAATAENARLLEESRQYARALQEADRRKDAFLAMLAHELRNPLAPVQNAVEILRLTAGFDVKLNNAREIISRQIAHMARLIDDLLDVARIARGKVNLRTQREDLVEIVRQTVEDYRPALSSAGIKLDLNLPDHPLFLQGDRTRLAQVIGNLLHNAGKFTPRQGAVSVQVASLPEGATARISVKDTGIGMEADVKEQLFIPFNQAEQTIDRARGGLGLGLALARGLVDLHGGSIVAESAGPGQGSEFIVLLPLAENSTIPHKSAQRSPGKVERKLRILVVEDNRDTAKSMQLLLTLFGHAVEVAYDGKSGYELAKELHPEVIISDLGLPGEMDGYEFARRLRVDPDFAQVHLIALSGYGQPEDRRRTQDAGFAQHLVKPVALDSLKKALQAVPLN